MPDILNQKCPLPIVVNSNVVKLSQESQCGDSDGRNEELATHCKARCSTVKGNWRSLGGAGADSRRDGTGSGGGCSGITRWVAVWHRDGYDRSRWGRDGRRADWSRGDCSWGA